MKRLFVVLLFLCFACVACAEGAKHIDFEDDKPDFSALKSALDSQPASLYAFNARLTNEEKVYFIETYSDTFFGFTFTIAGHHKVKTTDTAFALVHSNQSKKHRSEDFKWLTYCTELRVVDLAHNGIDNLDFLLPLKELRVVLLGDNKLNDISVLGKLPNLEYIELFKNRIESVAPLGNLNNLLDLNICFNKITDYSPLYGMPKLERLWIYSSHNWNSKPDKAKVEQLQNTLPGTIIDYTSYSTLGGWREHYRWYVIRNMTRRALTWLPWESDGFTQELTRIPQSEIERLARLWSTQRKIDQ